MTAIDNVNHPPHYTQHPSGVECSAVAEHFNFNIGNAVKYLWRAGLKGVQLEDLRKAAWYVNREIERISLTIDEREPMRDVVCQIMEVRRSGISSRDLIDALEAAGYRRSDAYRVINKLLRQGYLRNDGTPNRPWYNSKSS
jgi:hypothetical protein